MSHRDPWEMPPPPLGWAPRPSPDSRPADDAREPKVWCRPSAGGGGHWDIETIHKPHGADWEPMVRDGAAEAANKGLREALTEARKMIQTRETLDELGWGKGMSPATRLLVQIDAAVEEMSIAEQHERTMRTAAECDLAAAREALKAAEAERDEAQRNYERKCDDCVVLRPRAEKAEAEASRAFGEADEAYQRVAEIAGERDAAIAEIDRLRDGLRFYAQDRYEYEDGGDVEEDKGERARALLSEAGKVT